jgi:hypothetical protein
VDKLQAGVGFSLAVLPQATTFFQPSEGYFHPASFGKNNNAVQLIALARLHGRAKSLFHALCKGLPDIAAIEENALDVKNLDI